MKHLVLFFTTLILFLSCDKEDSSSRYTSDFIYLGYRSIEFTKDGEDLGYYYLFLDTNRLLMLSLKSVSSGLNLSKEYGPNHIGPYALYTINIPGYTAKQIDKDFLLALKLNSESINDSDKISFISKGESINATIVGEMYNRKHIWHLSEFNDIFFSIGNYNTEIIDNGSEWYGKRVYN